MLKQRHREGKGFGKWDVNKMKYKFIKELGRGGFGKVILVEHTPSGHHFSLKRVGKQDGFALSGEERLALQHPFIVQMMSSFIDERPGDGNGPMRILIFEYCRGPMFSVFCRRAPQYVAEHAPYFAAQLVLTLKHLDEARIVHRDVKPDNVLLECDQDGTGIYLKLADFGLATRWSDCSPQNKMCGTLQYMAPEMVTQQPMGRAVDWWALGVMIHEMVAGQNPFGDIKDQLQVMLKVAYADFEWSEEASNAIAKHGDMGVAAKDIVKRLLVRDPVERLEFAKDIAAHPFFDGIDWQAILYKQVQLPPPPPEALLVTEGQKDNQAMTTSISWDLDVLSKKMPTHSQPEFDALHLSPEPLQSPS